MGRGANQKLKLVYLQKILLENTDEEHPMSIAQMAAALADRGVDVRDRKSLYDDIEALRLSGLDIEGARTGRAYGYYVASRDFELAELKLLVDAVQSSRFITHKKTGELIRKVESLAGRHQARLLQRQVFVTGRIKAMYESIYYNVDAVSGAINEGKKVEFHYVEWQLRGGRLVRAMRRGGARYDVKPIALCWAEENYYMVGYDYQDARVKHFRVDKMQDITPLDAPAEPGIESVDMAAYSAKMFGMFGGENERVSIRFASRLIGVVADRFGRNVFISQQGEDFFDASVDVAVSPQFVSWIIGFGGEARVLQPTHVAQMVRDMAQAALDGQKMP